MKIAIRADASRTLGLGHVKRCLSLAHALRARGATVRFFTRPVDTKADTDTASSIEVEGFLASTLNPGAVNDELEDADVFLQRSRSFEPALVLVDHYSLGARWHRAVRATTSARLAALDDLGDRALDVDVLIDHNLATDHGLKYAGRLAPHTAVLGGPRYALLGPAYADAPRHRAAPWVRSIGIFMGGTDANNLSERALDACRRAGFEGEIEIATTSGNPNIDRLRHAADARAGVRITLDQVDLSAFFARHDLHIGAGGGATWERCCIAAPTLAVLAAANQYPVLLPLQQLGVLELVPSDPPTADDIAKALKPLLADATRRAALSAASRQLVDGHGAGRVADHLLAATSRANT